MGGVFWGGHGGLGGRGRWKPRPGLQSVSRAAPDCIRLEMSCCLPGAVASIGWGHLELDLALTQETVPRMVLLSADTEKTRVMSWTEGTLAPLKQVGGGGWSHYRDREPPRDCVRTLRILELMPSYRTLSVGAQ